MVLDLLDNIIPATLDIYAILFRSGSFNEYVETIFRIWTFALCWKRHNYNKAPLAFLSDIFYWEDTNHPFIEVVKLFLVNFNDYYVENYHSKIRAHTNTNNNVDNIIKQAFVIECKLITLGVTVDSQCLPTGFSTSVPHHQILVIAVTKNLIMAKGIYSNVKSFLERLEKGPNILTSEEREERENISVEENDIIEEIEINESQEVHEKFLRSLNYVNAW
ncbi:hypothetical protein Glove_334g58 [Diversispora epigaea]|uniref:Uncharacterized protein n=1 Tax=Diversispora epigaea TaxID=1348612 RepID=A0A397HIJ4_9GLOM|nr:hypothetical protein Glove_334g58 [Diversispora epigaea]